MQNMPRSTWKFISDNNYDINREDKFEMIIDG